MAQEVNDQNFQSEVKDFDGVALVDFWAPWCGPCKMQGPIIEELSQEMSGNDKVKITKLNVDDNQETAQDNQVLSIPTLKIFKNGEVVAEMVGLQSKDELVKKINEQLA